MDNNQGYKKVIVEVPTYLYIESHATFIYEI